MIKELLISIDWFWRTKRISSRNSFIYNNFKVFTHKSFIEDFKVHSLIKSNQLYNKLKDFKEYNNYSHTLLIYLFLSNKCSIALKEKTKKCHFDLLLGKKSLFWG